MIDQIRFLDPEQSDKLFKANDITTREWYAGLALQGLMRDDRFLTPPDGMNIADHLADNSFAIAEAMMKRKRTP